MIKTYILGVAALLATATHGYPPDEMRAKVPEWDSLLVKYGFDYDVYEVETLDSWVLTLFRITGKAGER